MEKGNHSYKISIHAGVPTLRNARHKSTHSVCTHKDANTHAHLVNNIIKNMKEDLCAGIVNTEETLTGMCVWAHFKALTNKSFCLVSQSVTMCHDNS